MSLWQHRDGFFKRGLSIVWDDVWTFTRIAERSAPYDQKEVPVPDKATSSTATRQPVAPCDKTLPSGSQANRHVPGRLMDRQRIERERLDRYGRFGGR